MTVIESTADTVAALVDAVADDLQFIPRGANRATIINRAENDVMNLCRIGRPDADFATYGAARRVLDGLKVARRQGAA